MSPIKNGSIKELNSDNLTKPLKSLLGKLRKTCPVKKGLIKKQKVEYFNGSDIFDCAKKFDVLSSDKELLNILTKLMKHACFLPVKKYTTEYKRPRTEIIDDETPPKKRFITNIAPIELNEFLNTNTQYYAWLYEPVSYWHYLACIGVLISIIGYYLKPFWPETLNTATFYLSICCGILIGFFFFVAALRYIIFIIVLLLTRLKIYFWIFPNLTKDCGFFDSFKPIYTVYRYQKKTKQE